MITEEDIFEDIRNRWRAARETQIEIPLDAEEVEMVIDAIAKQVGKLDRMLGSVVMYRGGGLTPFTIHTMQLMRVMVAHLRSEVANPFKEAPGGDTETR